MAFSDNENVLEYNNIQNEIVNIQNEIIFDRSDSTLSNASTIICDDT